MAISQNSKINTKDLVNRFKEVVVTRILDGVHDSSNPPVQDRIKDETGAKDQVVVITPTNLDSKKNVSSELVLGDDGDTTINATQLLTEIIRITRDLTRVGTYVAILKKKKTRAGVNAQGGQYTEPDDWLDAGNGVSGEALFTPAEIRQSFNGTGSNGGVVNGNVIKASDITNLFANMYEAWAKSDRPQKQVTVEICHDTCHSPCHSTCHTHCHSTCHGWSGASGTYNKQCHDVLDINGNKVDCEVGDVYSTGSGSVVGTGYLFPGYTVRNLFFADYIRKNVYGAGYIVKQPDGSRILDFTKARDSDRTGYYTKDAYNAMQPFQGSIIAKDGTITVKPNNFTIKPDGQVIKPK